jgi:hypothetical protein
MSTALTGSAGVYFVAARLNAMGFQCAPTFGNVPYVDILVSNLNGSSVASIQVKTTSWAVRERGRGQLRKPHHYEWDIGWKSARANVPNLFFALVDLKDFVELPDVFIIPSSVITAYFEGGNPETWRRARYHTDSIEELAPYKNNWDTLRNRLAESEGATL